MRYPISAFILLACSQTALAQPASFMCQGIDPLWELDILPPQGQLRFSDITSDFDIPDIKPAEGRSMPLAISLIGATDTAIAIVEIEDCQLGDQQSLSHEVQVLTQRRGLPIMLTGCCKSVD